MLSTTKYFNYTSLKRSGRLVRHIRSSKHYREYNKEEESKMTQILLKLFLIGYQATKPLSPFPASTIAMCFQMKGASYGIFVSII